MSPPPEGSGITSFLAIGSASIFGVLRQLAFCALFPRLLCNCAPIISIPTKKKIHSEILTHHLSLAFPQKRLSLLARDCSDKELQNSLGRSNCIQRSLYTNFKLYPSISNVWAQVQWPNPMSRASSSSGLSFLRLSLGR
jgi:hypothetical protein